MCKMVLKEVFDIENTYEYRQRTPSEKFKVTGHPVKVLHQLVPDIEYYENEEMNMDGSGTKTFTLTAYVNGFPYSAQGEFWGFC